MSLIELAKKSSISLRYLQKVEQNEYRFPSIQFVERIASALEISIQHLIKTGTEQDNKLNNEWLSVVIEAMESDVSKFQRDNKKK